MKILIVNDMLRGGGVERLMYDLVMRYHKDNQITILTYSNGKRNTEAEKDFPEGIRFLYRNDAYRRGRNFFDWRLLDVQKKMDRWKLKRAIAKEKFDLLLCVKEGRTMQLSLTYGGSIPRKIAWVHTDYSKNYYTQSVFGSAENEVAQMKRFSHVVCVSKRIVESIIKTIGNPGNLVLKYNPLNQHDILEKSKEQISDIRRKECPLFVSVGRLNYQKGYDILMEVCNLLNAEGLRYDVWIVGGGEDWNKFQVLHDLEEQIRRYKLDNVYLLGPRSNPYKYICMADWFLSSSRYEGYSYVSQEAAIIGKPVILTECAGVDELLKDCKNGFAVENSVKGLYQGMKDAILHPELARQYSDSCVAFSQEHYEKERFDAIEELFND